MSARVLGVITARAGSKGIPGKNTKRLAGKPLIAYTIEAAQASGAFDRLILSTGDERAAAVAHDLGCEVPFMRAKPTESLRVSSSARRIGGPVAVQGARERSVHVTASYR